MFVKQNREVVLIDAMIRLIFDEYAAIDACHVNFTVSDSVMNTMIFGSKSSIRLQHS